MSKSTPLSEIRSTPSNLDTGEPPNNQDSLIGEIIKEINEPDSTVAQQQNHQEQQDNALSYQLDPNINQDTQENQEQITISNMGDPHMSNYDSPQVPMEDAQIHVEQSPVAETNIDNITNNLIQQNSISSLPETSNVNTFFNTVKEPLLVVLLSILLSIPVINNLLISLLHKIPGFNSELIPVIIKAVLTGLLFFLIKKFI